MYGRCYSRYAVGCFGGVEVEGRSSSHGALLSLLRLPGTVLHSRDARVRACFGRGASAVTVRGADKPDTIAVL
jgi:hypothetical protein